METQQEARICIAQLKPAKGNGKRNLERIGDVFRQLNDDELDADVVVFPETFLSGYFLEGAVRELAVTSDKLADSILAQYIQSGYSKPIDLIIGFYELSNGKYYNSAAYLELTPAGVMIKGVHRKFFLPTYGVFDEERFVSPGKQLEVFPTRFGNASMLICEDIWHSVTSAIAALKGAQIIYALSASPGRGFQDEIPYNAKKYREMLVGIAEEHSVFVANASLVGFEGGKGFIGHSVVVDPFGKCLVEGPLSDEALITAVINMDDFDIARANSPLIADLEANTAEIALEFKRIAEKK